MRGLGVIGPLAAILHHQVFRDHSLTTSVESSLLQLMVEPEVDQEVDYLFWNGEM